MLERQCSEQNTADWREWYWLCQTVESLHHHHNHNIRFSIPLWYKYIFSIFSRGNRNLSTFFSLGMIRTKSFQNLLMLNRIWWSWRSSGSWAWQKLGEAWWTKIYIFSFINVYVYIYIIYCSSQPSMVHWLSSPIFPFVCSFVPLWWHPTKSHFSLPHTPKPIHFLKAYDNSYSKMN